MANKPKEINVEELRAQIEAEVKEQYEMEAKKQVEKAENERKKLEEKLSNQEKNLEVKAREHEKTIKQKLDAMKKVSIEIPEDPNNPDDVVPVGWQGVIYAIPRGQQFEVPEVIYQVWKESYEKTKEVNKRIRESIKKEIQVL
ncbi:hypothetical protein [Fictibacillus sp. JL2B1089]|uniref:hypothetical protein n=1 Tax=Fictibacillus sp. JL2B1089 TaxID=3399565 RepID=UPI003A8A5002